MSKKKMRMKKQRKNIRAEGSYIILKWIELGERRQQLTTLIHRSHK